MSWGTRRVLGSGGRPVRVGALAMLCVLMSGCWPQPNFDGGATRWNPYEQEITPATVASLRPAWSLDVTSHGPKPLLSGDRVIFGWDRATELGVRAVDAETGAPVWERTLSTPGLTTVFPSHPPTIIGGQIWAGWWGAVGNNCVHNNVRLTRDGDVVAEDPSYVAPGTPVQSGDFVVRTEATVCPGFPDHELVVSDVRTGEDLWTGVGPPANFNEPSAAGDLVVTGNGAFPLAGCGAPTCTAAWIPELVFGNDHYVLDANGPTFFAVRASVGVPDGAVAALSKADGTTVWLGAVSGQTTDLALDEDNLYASPAGSDGGLMAFDRDGCGAPVCMPRWSAPVPRGGHAPVVAGDVVYVAGGDLRIHAFPAEGCSSNSCPELASIPVPGVQWIESMAVAHGRLVVVSRLGTVVDGVPVQRISAYELPD
jgi:hypothetical protein